MERTPQTLQSIVDKLSPIDADWKNGFADEVIQELGYLRDFLVDHPISDVNLVHLFERNFSVYFFIFQLFLGISKDEFTGSFHHLPGGPGKMSFQKNREAYLRVLLENHHLRERVEFVVDRAWTWEDVLIDRLRTGRGSAIKGQSRGRLLEDMIETVIRKVFNDTFVRGCNFTGRFGEQAKAEFAIPNADDPKIIFEAKAYGATGSKQTDVTGDIEKICKVKRASTDFLFVTDGMTWRQRQSDLKKIVSYQNDGDILKIYTSSMMDELEADLIVLKREHNL